MTTASSDDRTRLLMMARCSLFQDQEANIQKHLDSESYSDSFFCNDGIRDFWGNVHLYRFPRMAGLANRWPEQSTFGKGEVSHNWGRYDLVWHGKV